eukprot:2679317-Rhodomonas_salina.1
MAGWMLPALGIAVVSADSCHSDMQLSVDFSLDPIATLSGIVDGQEYFVHNLALPREVWQHHIHIHVSPRAVPHASAQS